MYFPPFKKFDLRTTNNTTTGTSTEYNQFYTNPKKKILLWLDDFRNPFLDNENKVPAGLWEIHWVLNYDQFTKWIEKYGLPDAISFDHDLADSHYTPEEYWHDYEASKQWQEAQEHTEKTGKDCANWLVEYCMDNKVPLPEYFCHSANPVGKDNILGLLNQAKTIKW